MSAPRSWDVFCRVVDNYGDAGVCWRLARRLVTLRGAPVRLWIDDLAALAPLVDGLDVARSRQVIDGIEVRRWPEEWTPMAPAQVCIEAFGCGLPEAYAEALATARSLWIVLDYLSAEDWIDSHHGLPSPHPRLPVDRYYFFPGFTARTGGLLLEPGLLARRGGHDDAARAAYWNALGYAMPAPDATVVSIFGYPDAPLEPLLRHWARGRTPVVVAVADGVLAAEAAAALGGRATPGGTWTRDALELRVLPFVPQSRYDAGLWSADFLFVRGEDSFVRAQWAARPFVWQIYAQAEDAHHLKLEAFLARYTARLDAEATAGLTRLWRAWNRIGTAATDITAAWDACQTHRDTLARHGAAWAAERAANGDLAENLAEFCAGKLK